MTWWYAITLFAGAALMFAIQPFAGRAVLPALGGTAAVWAACLLFFQAALLAGYAWAHLVTARWPLRRQMTAHLLLLLAGAALLPPRVGGEAAAGLATSPWPAAALFLHLAARLGLPLVALAATAPLLQRWYSRSGRPDAADPYFLYAASNAGSLLALLAYPALVEPWFGLRVQGAAWTAGYAGFVVLIGVAARLAARGGDAQKVVLQAESEGSQELAPPGVSRRQMLRWLVLAAVPSSLSLGATLHLTTDIAATPLLWVLPLAVYLATYIVAFARGGAGWLKWADRALPFAAVAVAFSLVTLATEPAWLLGLVHLLALFAAGVVCHGRLAAERPPAEHLTTFYLTLAAGGALGGMFNALAAPLLFDRAAEYPLALVLACLLRPVRGPERSLAADVAWAAGVAAAALAMMFLPVWFPGKVPGGAATLRVLAAVPCVLAVCWPGAVRRVALGLAVVLLVMPATHDLMRGGARYERSFFGVTQVKQDNARTRWQIVHGNTIHGAQWLEAERRGEPLTYYHRTGPLGDVFRRLAAHQPDARVGVVGLGAGTMAAYGRAGEQWTFFEIDPGVLRVAADTNLFTYLADSAAAWRIAVGDARQRLAEVPDGGLDLLALDAFSSDAIPVHLLTREAFALYLRKLAPDGVIAVHISNRYANLEPVLAAAARELGLTARLAADAEDESLEPGKFASDWVILARPETNLFPGLDRGPWVPLEDDGRAPWTDDRASVMSVLRLW
ncbi:MAG: fused MFS/spermidine synthase [Limisphaerales bacterium]